MRKIIVGLCVVACVAPAMALAVRPAKNSNFATKSNNLSFDTNKKGTKLINVRLYSKCSTVPAMEGWPNIKVNRKGKFSKKGSIENVLSEKVNFEINGKFVKKKKAVGTYDVDSGDCKDNDRKFVAKRKGAATNQVL